MGKRKVDPEQIRFLYFHGWTCAEIARKLNAHPNTIYHYTKDLGGTRRVSPIINFKEAIRTTKERIELMFSHHNPCEFTWEENLVELLRGFRVLVQYRIYVENFNKGATQRTSVEKFNKGGELNEKRTS